MKAECIIFPGVGSYATAMQVLHDKGYVEPLKLYLSTKTKPFLGICLGMQTLFESSEEMSGNHCTSSSATTTDDTTNTTRRMKQTIPGLGIIPGKVRHFSSSEQWNHKETRIPHIGWNGRIVHQESPIFNNVVCDADVYFVHSYYAEIIPENNDWILSTTTYGSNSTQTQYISAIQNQCIVATQFHPEKSGTVGLQMMYNFLYHAKHHTLHVTKPIITANATTISNSTTTTTTQLTKRIVVALDVRTNDDGDLVVTKGDQYDVREKEETNETTTTTNASNNNNGSQRAVRNLGKPVALAQRYYHEGADEIAFLNITSFRQGVIEDMPMLHVLEGASKHIFVPLTVGGGIRSYTDPITKQTWDALAVASRYFRAGADKISLGSDAVYAAEAYLESNKTDGTSAIEQISAIYGVQAVVISIDPKRVYVKHPDDVMNKRHVVLS
jgi:imidazole glycerol-phosphate synthase